MTPEPLWYYDAHKFGAEWYSVTLDHYKSVQKAAKALGLDQSQVYHVKAGRKPVPGRVLARLGLQCVTQPGSPRIIGYIAREPIDWTTQWIL